jgi:hypothetical protein
MASLFVAHMQPEPAQSGPKTAFPQTIEPGICWRTKTPTLLSPNAFLVHNYYQTKQLRYGHRLNFLNFVKLTDTRKANQRDTVDGRQMRAYLTRQARPGREARLLQQPRHQP